ELRHLRDPPRAILRRPDQSERVAQLRDDLVGDERRGVDRRLPVPRVRQIRINRVDRRWNLELRQPDARRLQPVPAPPQHAPVNSRRPREPARPGRGRRRRRPHRPDDLEVLDPSPRPPGAARQVLERALHDAMVEADEQQHAVGDLAGELDRLWARGRHDQRDRSPRREGEPPRRPAEIHRVPSQQRAHGAQALAHLRQRRRAPADGAGRGVARAHHELHPPTASRLPRVSFREMRAVICRAWGPVDDLKLEDVAPPRPGPGQLVIDVKATGVNYADSIMVAGRYQTRPTFPFSPGLETAGVVTRCGEGVTRFKTGDRVMAILADGGFAEQALADEAETVAIPDAMPFDEAGAFPIAYISSHVAIRWQGRLLAGETLLVLGAAGGVGLTAVEIGKAMGARVIAGASTAEKLAAARERGADAIINYAAEKLTERVMELTDGKGADVCFDPVGGDLFDAALSALGWVGRILLIGFVGGIPNIPANRLLVKHRAALGSSLRYFRWHAPDKLRRSVEELLAWY